jgi:hypothetical protein
VRISEIMRRMNTSCTTAAGLSALSAPSHARIIWITLASSGSSVVSRPRVPATTRAVGEIWSKCMRRMVAGSIFGCDSINSVMRCARSPMQYSVLMKCG